VLIGRIEHMFETMDRSALETLAPGPELAGLLEADPAGLSGYDLVSFLGAAERLTAWAQSRQLGAIRELARRRPAPLGPGDAGDVLPAGGVSEFAANEVAAELRISTGGAQARLHLALALNRLPGTRVALAGGRLDLTKTRAIVEATDLLDAAGCLAVEARVLGRAPQQTLGRLRAALARAVIAADPVAAQVRHTQAVQDRRVELWALPDGMAALYAVLPAPAAVTCQSWLTALAEGAKGPGDERTLDQRRADVLSDLAFTGIADPDLPRRHGRPVQLQVAVVATTLLGLDDQPGELTGYGPITAEDARILAGDATWRRILTDPESGAVLDVGTTTYRPPQHLAELVIARDKTCRAPGCRIPARRCELDHSIRFPDGPTADTNLGCGCKHDHRMKHETEWDVEQLPDATFIRTSPTGHRYVVPPEPFLDLPPPTAPDPPHQPDPPDPELDPPF
jgi:hypothetical protein